MNKVFSMSQNSAVEKGREIIENAKRAFIGFFGKKYEGRICSNLDYGDYVYFGSGKKDWARRAVFAYDFFDGELGQYIKERFSRLEAKRIRGHLADVIYGKKSNTIASCVSNFEKNRLEQISFLPTDASNRVYLHELLHIISTNIVNKDGKNKKCLKHGFRVKNFGVAFNEIFTEYSAYLIDKYMKRNGLPLLAEGHSAESAYLDYFGSLAPFFQKHYDVLVQSYFGDDLSACYEAFGKDNFENILMEVDRMLNKRSIDPKYLSPYLKAADKYNENLGREQ